MILMQKVISSYSWIVGIRWRALLCSSLLPMNISLESSALKLKIPFGLCQPISKLTNLFYNGSAWAISALINTGITAPVGRRNSRCPITLRSEAIDPECVVNEIYVLSSWVNISSSSFFMRVWIIKFRVSGSYWRGIVESWDMYEEGDTPKTFLKIQAWVSERTCGCGEHVHRELNDFLERRGATARLPRRIRARWCMRGSWRGCKSYCCAGHKCGFRLLREVVL